jgi:Flp pilus assembly protein TadG
MSNELTLKKRKRIGRIGGVPCQNQEGMAAVEFALCLPFMLLLYFGAEELLQGISLNRQTTMMASTVANIVTQYTSISQANQLPDILQASVQVMAPYPSASARVVVTCINIDNAGNATVGWSQALNTGGRSVGQAVSVPAAMNVPNTSVIFAESAYDYTPPYDFLHLGTITLTGSVYMVPRASTTINLGP